MIFALYGVITSHKGVLEIKTHKLITAVQTETKGYQRIYEINANTLAEAKEKAFKQILNELKIKHYKRIFATKLPYKKSHLND